MPEAMPQHDYYEILQVHPKATLAVIKKAYRTLLLELGNHPDQGGDSVTAALITEAYGVLSDPTKRAHYDRGYFVPAENGPRRAAETVKPENPTEGSSLIVLCPRCRTKNRVRSQELLAVAKCSRCGQALSRLPNPFIELREQAIGYFHKFRDAWQQAAAYRPEPKREDNAHYSATRAAGPVPRPRAKAVPRFFSVGVPLLLIGASLIASGYALTDLWQGMGDPVAAAGQLEKEGKLDQAAKRLERAVDRDPGNARLFELLGDIYDKQNDPVHALQNYATATKLNPQNSYYWDLQGGVYQRLGKHDPEAEMCFRHALKIDPQYAPALVALGNLEAKSQHFDEAIADYKQALRSGPSSDVYYNLGLVYQWNGHADDAVKSFKQALIVDPNNRSSMVSLAALYYEQHQYDSAAAQLITASHLKHTDLDLHLRLAEIYERTGHTKEAIREWNVCLDQSKGNPLVVEKVRHALDRLHVTNAG
jgi:cytochrome c-type biogenesis protein CcmH/NrfG